MKIIKIAIIGSGYIANEYAKVLKKIKNCKISGIYSRKYIKAKLFAKKHNVKIIGRSIEDLYMQTRADAVIVAVSPDSLRSITKEIFKFSWLSLIEKPLGINESEAKSINKLSRDLKRRSFIALNRRHYSSTLKSIDLLKLDNSKRIINIYGQEDLNKIKKLKFNKKIIDNYMYVNGIHLIDYMTIFCRGKIKKIEKPIKWKGYKRGYVLSVFYFSSGDIATFSTIWNKPSPWQVIVTTDKQRIELKPLENCKLIILDKKIEKNYKIDQIDKVFKPGLYRQTNEFIKNISNPNKSLMDINHGYKLMKILKNIYKH